MLVLASKEFQAPSGLLKVDLVPCGGVVDPIYTLNGEEKGFIHIPDREIKTQVEEWVAENKLIYREQAKAATRQMFEQIAAAGEHCRAYERNSSWNDTLSHVYWDERSLDYRGRVWFLAREKECISIDPQAIGYSREFSDFVWVITKDLNSVGTTLGGGSNSIVLISEEDWNAIASKYRELVKQKQIGDLQRELEETQAYLESLPAELPSEAEALISRERYNNFVNEGGCGFVPHMPSQESKRLSEERVVELLREIEALRNSDNK